MIKDTIPGCVTTDLLPHPSVDRQENAYRLSFEDGSISHLILFDVWHHLRYPGTALAEFHRVLTSGGRVILFEPAISWMGRIVYGMFHHEPLGLGVPLTWEAPSDFSPDDPDDYSAQGAATRVFWWNERDVAQDGWHVLEVTPFVSFTYLASGGFSGRERGGPRLASWLPDVDRALGALPRLFAARLLVVLEAAGN